MSFSERAQDAWRRASQRERIALMLGAGVCTMAACYVVLWRPMTDDLARIELQLPRLRAQAAQLRLHGAEVEALRARPAAAPLAAKQAAALIAATAKRHGLQVEGLEPGNAGVWRVRLRGGFSEALGWADELHRSHRLAIAAARFTAIAGSPAVAIEAEMVLPR